MATEKPGCGFADAIHSLVTSQSDPAEVLAGLATYTGYFLWQHQFPLERYIQILRETHAEGAEGMKEESN